MTDADLSSSRRTRMAAAAAVAALHILALLALVHAFAPQITQSISQDVIAAFSIEAPQPEPTPTPPPPPPPTQPENRPAGAEGAAGKRATPKEITAPRPKIELAKQAAPPVAGKGNENSSGARDDGQGTGAGNSGDGRGSGSGGDGTGGGIATKAVHVSGNITSARDYPRDGREQRSGDYVTVALTVATDGRVRTCRILRASRDPQADRITCDLAKQRFRFRPAMDASGNPVESTYGWRQRWYEP